MRKIKVSAREIVIMVVMLTVVLYGAYDFFIDSSPRQAGVGDERAKEIDMLIAKASKTLQERGSYPFYAAVLTQAQSEWERDPFYRENKPVKRTPDLRPIAYTGYLEIGTRKIAVVDGVSYEPGEELEQGGFLVKRIGASSIDIEEKGTGRTIAVPLWEE